jgi:hypothetical protein
MIAKQGTIKWHELQIKKLRGSRSKAGKAGAKARVEKHFSHKEGYGNNLKKNTTPPPTKYRSRVEYDFLKYIRLAFKWAQENYGLSRPQVELLLFLYGTGAFSKKQFTDYHKTVGMYADKRMTEFIEEGWVTVWRPANKAKKIHKLYVLTQKGKSMCGLMHKYCCGVAEIPMTSVSNLLVKNKDDKRINGYYLDAIKRMNKDKAPD